MSVSVLLFMLLTILAALLLLPFGARAQVPVVKPDRSVDTKIAPAYFGPDADLEAIEKEVRIYAGLKTLIVERDTRCPMPEFRAMLEGTIY